VRGLPKSAATRPFVMQETIAFSHHGSVEENGHRILTDAQGTGLLMWIAMPAGNVSSRSMR
jgi:hypothetical protein